MGQAAPPEVGLGALGSFGLRMLCAFALIVDAWMGESLPFASDGIVLRIVGFAMMVVCFNFKRFCQNYGSCSFGSRFGSLSAPRARRRHAPPFSRRLLRFRLSHRHGGPAKSGGRV
jgi:hypothetical protein